MNIDFVLDGSKGRMKRKKYNPPDLCDDSSSSFVGNSDLSSSSSSFLREEQETLLKFHSHLGKNRMQEPPSQTLTNPELRACFSQFEERIKGTKPHINLWSLEELLKVQQREIQELKEMLQAREVHWRDQVSEHTKQSVLMGVLAE